MAVVFAGRAKRLAAIGLAMTLASLFPAISTFAQPLSRYETDILNSLSAPRTLATMRDISRVVITETSGAGRGTVVSGSPEERILATALAGKMSALGLEVRQETFPVRSFTYGLVTLAVGDEQIDAVTLHSGGGTWGEIDGVRYAVGNANEGRAIRAPLADVGEGLADDYARIGDVSGKVVLVHRGPAPGWPNYSITEAAERGAVAIVLYDYSKGSFDTAIRQDSVWYRDMIPVVSISKQSAARLQTLLAGGAVTLDLENRVDASYGTSQNVLGVLRGSAYADEWVIVSGHYDRWFNSDFDNNIGPAVVLELAEVLTKSHQPLRNILFIAYGSEEAGTINTTYDWLAGSYAFVKAHPEIMSRLVYAFNIDGAGWKAKYGRVVATPDNIPFQRELLSALSLEDRLEVTPGPTANLDSWTMGAIGGGAVSNIAWFSPRNEGGFNYGAYYHTQLDVHADSQYANLDSDLRMGTLGVLRASSSIRVPLSLAAVASWVADGLAADMQRLAESGADSSLFAASQKAVERFRGQAKTSEATLIAGTSTDDVVQMNRRLMNTRHELLPWLYEYGEYASRVRSATPVGDIVAVRRALAAVRTGDTAAAASALADVNSMSWGRYLSPGAYATERLLWLEPAGWRSEYEQSPMQLDPEVHALYLALKNGEKDDAVLAGLARLEVQAMGFLRDALFLISGKLDAATEQLARGY